MLPIQGVIWPLSAPLTRSSLTLYRPACLALQVVPDAFRVTRLKPGRRFCVLGRLSDEIGWKFADVVDRLEAKRKAADAIYYDTKKAELAKISAAKAAEPGAPILAKFGY